LDFRFGILIGFSAARKVHKAHKSLKEKTIIKIAQQYHIKRVLFTNLIQRQGKEFKSTLLIQPRKRNSKTTNNPTAKYTQKMQFCLKKQSMV
jgi:vancomycin permeability regulator SanA